ncbi:FGGY of carbohydrate kinases N-terminal domain family protein [Acanthocheilonema viteae]
MLEPGDCDEKRGTDIIAIDIGTTAIKVCLYDSRCRLISYAKESVTVQFKGANEDGLRAEIDPDILWNQLLTLISELLDKTKRDARAIVGMGISCQRNTFICWNKENGEPCHRLVTWKDCRARDECKKWNNSWSLKAIKLIGYILHKLTRSARCMAARIFSFLNAMVTHRFLVTLAENEEMQRLLKQEKLGFGCLDTWLIYKLSSGVVYVSEPSNASSTGLFDPYTMEWGYNLLQFFSFPASVLPRLTFSAGVRLAVTDKKLFGAPIIVAAAAGDQQSALFACGCWMKNSAAISLGTGSFVDVNTGALPHSSLKGLYPLVGWNFPNSLKFVAEGCSQDTAIILRWAESIGLFEDVATTSQMAQSCSISGLYFIPAFFGIQTPLNDDSACCGFLGIRPDTTKKQMVRAMLESIAFRIYQIWRTVTDEIDISSTGFVRCCGGVSANDFICQTISTLIELPLQRINSPSFASACGVAMMAGITCGLWKKDDLDNLINIEKVFVPDLSIRKKLLQGFEKWEKAMQRCLHFYDA